MIGIGLLLGAGFGLGLRLLLAGWQGVSLGLLGRRGSPGNARTGRSWRLLASRRELVLAGVGLVLGVVAAVLAGWVVAIVLVPVLAVLLPRLLSSPPTTSVDRLEALEEWARSLAGLLGHSALQSAIVATRSSTPAAIRQENERLIARLLAYQSLSWALQLWAEEIDDETGDYVAAALIQAHGSREAGLSHSLEAIASDVAREVQARRKVVTEQRREFGTARAIAAVAITAMSLFVLFSELGRFYAQPLGQLVLLGVVACFLGSLAWMQKLGTPEAGVRILAGPSAEQREPQRSAP